MSSALIWLALAATCAFIEGTRSLRTLKTTARLNDLLERADPLARRHTALRRSGDFAPFLQAGVPATAIESNGTPAFWPSYHTRRDTWPW
jgi:Iap family predicted aminopeptidase